MVEREAEEKKQRSLRNEKLKANRASVTEEQRRERLRIRHEKGRAKRTKKYKRKKKRSSVTEDNENQRQATLKRLKRGDENELERNLRLEKEVTRKQLKFAMETDAERKAEDGRNHTAQVGPGDGGRKKSKKRNEFNLDLISKFFLRNELAHPVMGTIFLVEVLSQTKTLVKQNHN